MTEEYITPKQLEKKLMKYSKISEINNLIKEKTFSHHFGIAIKDTLKWTITVIGIGYIGMSIAYGPWDAGKVIYSEFSGNMAIKERTFEEAKFKYAKNIGKDELSEKDMKGLYKKLEVVPENKKMNSIKDISWYTMFDWIEDN